MTYRGHVRNGRIELDHPADLPEGAAVELSVVEGLQAGGIDRSPVSGLPIDAQSIEDELERIWADVPDSEWAKLPADLTDQLDHYIYGTPKR